MTETARFGLEKSLTDAGGKFVTVDRDVIDRVLAALETHDHTGGANPAPLASPTSAPTAVSASSGGTLVDGQTLYYQVSYLDEFGLETAGSPEVTVSLDATPSSTVAPNPTGSHVNGDTLTAATYYYALTVVTTSGESALGPEAIITVTADQNHVDVGLPALPTGATSFGVWRMAITDAGWTRIATAVTGSSFADTGFPTGSCLTDPATQPPDGIAGLGTNAVTVTVPDPELVSSLPSAVKRWRLYRSDVSGNYGATSLVAEVAIPGLGEALPTTFVDTGAPLLDGQPLLLSTTLRPSVGIGGGAGITGVSALPTADAEHRGHIVYVEGTGGDADQAYICLLGTSGTVYSWVAFAIGVTDTSPAAPEGIDWTAPGETSIHVNAISPPSTGPTPDHYLVFLMNADASSVVQGPVEVAAGSATTTFTGLTAGTTYTLRAVGEVAGASGPAFDQTASTQDHPFGAPTGVTVTPAGTSAVVSWTAPADPGIPAFTDYFCHVEPAGGGAWITSATIPSGTTSWTPTGLTAGTAYTVVVATEGGGTQTPASAGFTTTAAVTLPADVAPRSLTWTPSDCAYNVTSSTLSRYVGALLAGGPVKILCKGDSTIAGYGTGVTPDVGSMPVYLAADLAAAGHALGEGWSFPSNNEPGGFTDGRWTYTGTWTHLGGYLHVWAAAGATATFTSGQAGTVAQFATLGDSGPWTLLVDGVAPTSGVSVSGGGSYSAGTVTPGGNPTVVVVTITGLANTTHTIKMTVTGSTDTHAVAARVHNPSGFEVSNAGIGGSQTSDWTANFAYYQPRLLASALVVPDLTIISLGLNDYTNGVTSSTFKTSLQTIAAADAVGSDVLLLVPATPDPAAIASWTAWRQAYYNVADALNIGLIDAAAVLGGGSSYVPADMFDNEHPNATGYGLIAAAISSAIA